MRPSCRMLRVMCLREVQVVFPELDLFGPWKGCLQLSSVWDRSHEASVSAAGLLSPVDPIGLFGARTLGMGALPDLPGKEQEPLW